ncbi:MAG: hypothetical protein ETSY2_34735 [Candidatus Entotheonella gemina]|uniref:Uncharacterized protein n=1 Tax=Candidatus Entotheonella gemina TaxID=1429439 RepID=W4LY75_9BACT|nr:MAG: hypothetical protein ETSY2_34735 [Candidatus Entotheonella gemina]
MKEVDNEASKATLLMPDPSAYVMQPGDRVMTK